MTASIQFKKLETFGFCSYIDFIVTSQETGVENLIRTFLRSVWKRPDVLPIPAFLLAII